MKQQELFKAAETERDIGKKILEIIEAGVHRMGIKDIAFLLNREPKQLRDAFNENGKYYSVTWLPTVLIRDPQCATDFINLCCDLAGKKYPKDREKMTDKEKIYHYEQIITAHGLEAIFQKGK